MGSKILALLLVLFCARASMGCELEAIMHSALECGAEGTLFNLTKYITHINQLADSGFRSQSIEEFFMNNTIAEMLEMFGELEPAAVWLASSFYDEHLKDLVDEMFIRPMFGDMSNMAQLLTDSLNSHCQIVDELMTCFVAKLGDKCQNADDVTRMKELFLDPFQATYCSGATPKSESISWLAAHSDGLTTAFSCIVDPNHPPERLDFIDFERNPVLQSINFGRIVPTCNLDSIGVAIEDWAYDQGIIALFSEDFNLTTFNIFTIVDLNLEDTFMHFARPMADCVIRQFLPIGSRLCPNLDVTQQIAGFADVMKFMLPFYTDFQDDIKDMFLNPLPLPNYASQNRHSKALIGSYHTYTLSQDMWESSCPSLDRPRLILSWSGSMQRFQDGSIYISGLYGDGILFRSTGGIFMQFNQGEWDTPYKNLSDVEPSDYYGLTSTPYDWLIDTDYVSYYTFMLPPYGAMISVQNPTGSNWVVFVRAGIGAYDLAFGSMTKGCGSHDTKSGIPTAVASAVSQSCVTLCADLSALNDACEFDCISNKEGMPAELAALADFDSLAARFDSDMIRFSANRGEGKYAPCSAIGFINNVGAQCVWEAMLEGSFPSFNLTDGATIIDWMAEIGIIEPYALYGTSALVKEFVLRTPVRSFMDVPPSDLTAFVDTAVLTTAVGQHCRAMDAMAACLEREIPQYCPRSQEELLNSYIAPLKTRYCTGTSIKQEVIDAMIAARDVLLDEMSCFVNLTNTAEFQFDDAKLMRLSSEMVDRCEFENVIFYITSVIDSGVGDVLNQIKELVRLARNPVRCAVRVVEPYCPGIDMSALVDKLLVHLNRVTAGVLGIDKEYFINTQQINYGSRERVSMWAVGDPHIRALGSDEFTVCNSPGITTYFSSDEGARFEIEALNDPASMATNATVIREIYIKAWAPGADYGSDPMVSYTVKNGTLKTTFDDGQTDVVVGEFSIFIEPRHNGRTVFIQNMNSGTFVAIQPYRTFYNLVFRTSRSYAETGSGLLVFGCGVNAQDASSLNEQAEFEESMNRRRKRSVSVAQCQTACASVDALLREQCEYDCLAMEDTEIGQAHSAAIEIEAEVVVDDVKVETWLPDLYMSTTKAPADKSTTTQAASNVFMSTCLLIFPALALLR